MEQFTFYDLETTGTNVRFDIPLQFAAVRTNSELDVVEEIEFRGRPPAHILPAPGALITTRQRIADAYGAPNSFSEFMGRIETVISGGPPSCMVAFNGIRFDEEMLRHSFYQTLRKPYQTQFGGNARADAMLLVQAVNVLCPGVIQVPRNEKGNPTFKLELLAQANGLKAANAHDALADVYMMLDLLRLVRLKVPDVWELLPLWTDKAALERLLKTSDVVLKMECLKGVGRTRSLYPLCANPAYPTEWSLVDLNLEPGSYLGMSPHDLLNAMKQRATRRPIFKAKINAMPLLLPGNSNLAKGLHTVDESTARARVQMLRSEPTFADRVGEAMKMIRESYEEPEHVEDQLYSGGFFPLREDEGLVERFHASAPVNKFDVLSKLCDPRALRLGERMLFSECPEVLPPEKLATMKQGLHARLTEDSSVPWMTAPKALREIEDLRGTADPVQSAILGEYEDYLVSKFGRLAA